MQSTLTKQDPSGSKQGQGTVVPNTNTLNSNSNSKHTPMVSGQVTESKPSSEPSIMFRQGTKHFKTQTLGDALYMLASLLNLIKLNEDRNVDPSPEIAELIANSKLPLFKINEDNTEEHICHPDELQPLANALEKLDLKVKLSLGKLIKTIKERQNDKN